MGVMSPELNKSLSFIMKKWLVIIIHDGLMKAKKPNTFGNLYFLQEGRDEWEIWVLFCFFVCLFSKIIPLLAFKPVVIVPSVLY